MDPCTPTSHLLPSTFGINHREYLGPDRRTRYNTDELIANSSAMASDDQQVARKAKSKVYMYHCALYQPVPGKDFMIGGQNLHARLRHNLRADFVIASRNDKCTSPYVGLTIRFPRAKDDPATYYGRDGKPTDHLQVTLQFLQGTFHTKTYPLDPEVYKRWFNEDPSDQKMGVLHITMDADKRPQVSGVGTHFRGEKAKHYADPDFPLHEFPPFSKLGLSSDHFTIGKVLDQKDFHVIFKGCGIFRKAENGFGKELCAPYTTPYPLGSSHGWDMERYETEFKDVDTMFPCVHKHDGDNDALTKLTRSAAYDIFPVAHAASKMRNKPLPARCVKIQRTAKRAAKPEGENKESQDEEPDRFYVMFDLSCLGNEFTDMFRRLGTLDSILNIHLLPEKHAEAAKQKKADKTGVEPEPIPEHT